METRLKQAMANAAAPESDEGNVRSLNTDLRSAIVERSEQPTKTFAAMIDQWRTDLSSYREKVTAMEASEAVIGQRIRDDARAHMATIDRQIVHHEEQIVALRREAEEVSEDMRARTRENRNRTQIEIDAANQAIAVLEAGIAGAAKPIGKHNNTTIQN